MDKKYRLRYLPLFDQDLSDISDYIALRLQNPIAAQRKFCVQILEKVVDFSAGICYSYSNVLDTARYSMIRGVHIVLRDTQISPRDGI
jgi:hypothetical protein